MKRNCNLELRLVTPSVYHHSMLDIEIESPNKKQLTIFYNGKVASSDATEIQAKAIISLAHREMEDKFRKISNSTGGCSSPVVVKSVSADYSPTSSCINNGLSMKRSLQRFLEKRKTRAHSLSPYSNIRRQ